MNERIFALVPDHLLEEAQRAARALLVHGLVTPAHPDEATFRRVRRWAPDLARDLASLTGWQVHDSRAAVRLERRMDALDSSPWWPVSGVVPDARLLALLCLGLAALERAGDQTLLSDLAVVVRAAAVRAGLAFDPAAYADRRALCQVVAAVARLGVISIRDGGVEAWRDDLGQGEALIDVDAEVLRLFFLPPVGLHGADDAASLLVPADGMIGREAVRARRRQRVVRALLDSPVVYFADLDEADQTYLRYEARGIADDVERLLGAVLERRAEGMALVFTDAASEAHTLPEQGSDTLAALALAAELAPSLADPHAARVTCPPVAHPPPRRHERPPPPVATGSAVFVPDARLAEAARACVIRLSDSLRADLRVPAGFVEAALERLVTFDLVRRVPGGVCVLPALARFREIALKPVEASP